MFIFSKSVMAVLVLAATVQLSACNNQDSATENQDAATSAQNAATNNSSSYEQQTDRANTNTASAVAELEATEGNNTSGTVSFTALDRGVRIKADIKNLAPGRHGMHIHARGDCSAPDASSAGGHFNPNEVGHGAPVDETHHAGDLGNIEANSRGRAVLESEFPFLELTGENGIVGKAVVVHASADDLESQPAGDSGPRVACGVIRGDSQ